MPKLLKGSSWKKVWNNDLALFSHFITVIESQDLEQKQDRWRVSSWIFKSLKIYLHHYATLHHYTFHLELLCSITYSHLSLWCILRVKMMLEVEIISLAFSPKLVCSYYVSSKEAQGSQHWNHGCYKIDLLHKEGI